MLNLILIATIFSFGFCIESIVGFGGGLIAYSILGFFLDLKEMILIGLYVGTLASAYIIFTDRKSFDKKIFISILPLSLLGTIIGVFIFSKMTGEILGLGFGALLIFLGLKILFFDNYKLPRIFKEKLILIGGICHGVFGIGGPFWVSAIKNDFKNKSTMRTTLAVTFVFFNIIRYAQLGLQDQISLDFFLRIWWIIIPVFLAIQLGYHFHLKISEAALKKAIAYLVMLSGMKFLISFF